jgi:tight adherence protein C
MLAGAQVIISLVVAVSVLALVTGVRAIVASGEPVDHLQQFMDTSSAASLTLRELEMRASFYQRALRPLFTVVLQRLGRMAPQRNIEELQRKLDTAGLLARFSVVDFLGLKILCGVFLGILCAALIFVARSPSLIIVGGLGILMGIVGSMLPNLWLSRRIKGRQREILKAMPDALDMMSICVNAGLGLQGAMQTVCENWDNPLADEFTRALTEIRLGRGMMEALESMGQRTKVKEVMSFILSLSMAYKLGVSLAKVLPIQAEQMRVARRQKAEEAAREASIKMLFPLVFLVFPAMFAVILGPAVPQLMETMGGL